MKRNRSSKTGEFVSEETKTNPDTTVSERYKKPPLGVYPRKLWLEDRREAVIAALGRNPKDEVKYHEEISWIDSELERFVGLNYQGKSHLTLLVDHVREMLAHNYLPENSHWEVKLRNALERIDEVK